MKTIKTVNGPITPEQLGFCDIHDHLWKSGGMEVLEDKDFGMESVEKSAQELKSFAAAGGRAMVDMQPIGVGRGVEQLKTIAQGSGVDLVAITGFHRGKLYDKTHFVHRYTTEQMTELVLSEVREGIEVNDFCGPYVQHSDVKPGLIKAGTDYYKITPLEEKLMEVVSRVHVQTDIPVITHTHQGTMGLEQARFFKSRGVAPERICIGHLDRDADLVYHEKVLGEGVYVQYDCVARVKYHPIKDTMDLIKTLSERGYAERIMIGGDWGRASYLKAYGGAPGLEYIPKYVPALMRDYGISQEVIDLIFIENPRRFLPY